MVILTSAVIMSIIAKMEKPYVDYALATEEIWSSVEASVPCLAVAVSEQGLATLGLSTGHVSTVVVVEVSAWLLVSR